MTNEMVPCRGCAAAIHKTAAICPHCGAPQRTKRYKSSTTAGVLAILIGGFGVHRFYLGQWWGIFYLLFWWTAIPGLVSVIEGIVFLVSNEAKWDEKYNEGIPGQGESSAGFVIAIIAGALFLIILLGIVAAVALPAYQDYTARTKVVQAVNATIPVQQRVAEYVLSNDEWPQSNTDIGIDEDYHDGIVEFLEVGPEGNITITFSSRIRGIGGETMVFTPDMVDEQVVWECVEGSLPNRYRSAACRQ